MVEILNLEIVWNLVRQLADGIWNLPILERQNQII
jgi:hypothetical protein